MTDRPAAVAAPEGLRDDPAGVHAPRQRGQGGLLLVGDVVLAGYGFRTDMSEAARDRLTALFPDAIVVGGADAYAFGLNAVSDGLHVVLLSAATSFAAQLRAAGFDPIGVDLSELLKGGGSVKCCTLEVHP